MTVIFHICFFIPVILLALELVEGPDTKYEVEADLILWRTEETNDEYLSEHAITLNAAHGLGGDIERAQFDWQPGFRVALSREISKDKWYLTGMYGYFQNSGDQIFYKDPLKTITGTFPQILTTIEKASSNIYLRINFAELYLSRTFRATEKITFSFFEGISAAWFKQHWEVIYYQTFNGGDSCHIKPHWTYKGGGILVGALSDWLMGKGFNWSCKFSLACLFGNNDNIMNIYTEVDQAKTIYENSHFDDFRIVTHLHLLMGPSYIKHFTKSLFKIFLAFETNVWFNLHQVDKSAFSATNPQSRFVLGAIQTIGGALSFQLDF